MMRESDYVSGTRNIAARSADGGGGFALEKNGEGTLTLTGANTYTVGPTFPRARCSSAMRYERQHRRRCDDNAAARVQPQQRAHRCGLISGTGS